MVNCSFHEGLVPDGFKKAVVTPLIKKASLPVEDLKNYLTTQNTALLSIKNVIHLSLSRGEAIALVILDLSASFDMIDHSNLLSCLLDWFGVGGSALK